MLPGISLYLDLIRLLASIEVFVFHLSTFGMLGVGRAFWNAYGHEAVTIFFVMSGFVIRHAVSKPKVTLRDFSVNRISRVYAVALPCLILTLLFDWLGRGALPALYKGLVPAGPPFEIAGIGSLMLNENWGSTLMLSNVPYWSISYEFWYYWIFAALFFCTGWTRWLWAAVFVAIAGPNIMLMFPIWAMGWWAYRWRDGRPVATWAGWLLFLQPLVVFFLYDKFHWIMWSRDLLVPIIGFHQWHVGLGFSRFFVSDLALGVCVTAHLLGARAISPVLEMLLARFGRAIRALAGHSFTLYLLHQPAMLLIGAFAIPHVGPEYRGWVIAALTLPIILGVSVATEIKREWLRAPLLAVIDFMGLRMKWSKITQ